MTEKMLINSVFTAMKGFFIAGIPADWKFLQILVCVWFCFGF